MTTHRSWYRLAIDLDSAGNPIGTSVELHFADELVGLVVLEVPGPFELPREVLDRALTEIYTRWGIHQPFGLREDL